MREARERPAFSIKPAQTVVLSSQPQENQIPKENPKQSTPINVISPVKYKFGSSSISRPDGTIDHGNKNRPLRHNNGLLVPQLIGKYLPPIGRNLVASSLQQGDPDQRIHRKDYLQLKSSFEAQNSRKDLLSSFVEQPDRSKSNSLFCLRPSIRMSRKSTIQLTTKEIIPTNKSMKVPDIASYRGYLKSIAPSSQYPSISKSVFEVKKDTSHHFEPLKGLSEVDKFNFEYMHSC